jgi:hypothetical protein
MIIMQRQLPAGTFMHPEINRPPNGGRDRVGFLFTWRHNDGSLVAFGPDGWTSSDPNKTAWLKAMNDLVSSAPAIAPGVRLWLKEECKLVEFREPYHEAHFLSSNQ